MSILFEMFFKFYEEKNYVSLRAKWKITPMNMKNQKSTKQKYKNLKIFKQENVKNYK